MGRTVGGADAGRFGIVSRVPLSPVNDPLHTTNDAHLAAFLVTEGARFVGLERSGPKRVHYSFIADRQLHSLIRVYRAGHPVLIVPCRLLGTLHDLRCLSIARSAPFSPSTPV